jgi:hypothetical protein
MYPQALHLDQQQIVGLLFQEVPPPQRLQKERLRKAHLAARVVLRHRQALVAQHMLAATAARQLGLLQRLDNVGEAEAVLLGLPQQGWLHLV